MRAHECSQRPFSQEVENNPNGHQLTSGQTKCEARRNGVLTGSSWTRLENTLWEM